MINWTWSPWDKISHSLLGVFIWLPCYLAGEPWLGVYVNAIGWYMREQAQEWHMCRRCREAYLPWKWRRDSILDASWPIGVVAVLTVLTGG